MEERGYQGWTTWETWAVFVTVTNFRDFYGEALRIVQDDPEGRLLPVLCAEWVTREPGRLLPDLRRVDWPQIVQALRAHDPN